MRQRDAEQAMLRDKQRQVAELNAEAAENRKLQRELANATSQLKKRKAELQDHERLLETKHAVKRFSTESLGQSNKNAGGPTSRKRRFEVLDRLARQGSGLSPAQKNDWVWWKEEWDARMVQEHRENWGETFAEWMQAVLDQLDKGLGNAFSVFVYDETRRCFDGVPALRAP